MGENEDFVLANEETLAVVEVDILYFIYLAVEPIQVQLLVLEDKLCHKLFPMILAYNFECVCHLLEPLTDPQPQLVDPRRSRIGLIHNN